MLKDNRVPPAGGKTKSSNTIKKPHTVPATVLQEDYQLKISADLNPKPTQSLTQI